MIHIYYGYGKGKTSSAIGAGMRAYGAGMSVSLVQFLKGSGSSELNSIPLEVFRSPDELSFNPGVEYQEWVDAAIEYISSCDSDVIILDEFLDIIDKFITLEDALALVGGDREYIITGHTKWDKLIDIADYATHYEKVRHPFDKGISARKGIEY